MKKQTNFEKDGGADRDYLKGKDLSNDDDIKRGKPSVIIESMDHFKFMQIDVDYYTTSNFPHYLGIEKIGTEKVVLRMFGITEQGNSVMLHIHNFLPYLYVELNSTLNDLSDKDLLELKQSINEQLHESNPNTKEALADFVLHIEVQKKASVYYYHEKMTNFLKIYCSIPSQVSKLRTLFEKQQIKFKNRFDACSSQTYESNLPFPLRFMIDNSIGGMQWIELQAGKYLQRADASKVSTCQYEIDVVDFRDVESVPLEIDSKIAPLRILSFDIECSSTTKGKFPTANEDPIIQIANIVKVHGQKEPFVRNVFTLNYCAPIVGTRVYSCKTEWELLKKWRDFIQEVDPDIITGYNTQNFDIPYIIDRASHLKHDRNYATFGRLKTSVSKVKEQTMNIKALGTRVSKDVNIDGRVQLDMMQVVIRDHKLRSYSLNSVAYTFLNEQKEDVPYNIISDLQNENEFTRRRLAIYCVKDAFLPLRLLEKLMCLFNLTEMARVTGVPINYLFSRGQQIKVASQLYRKAKEMDLVIPIRRIENLEDKYEGAIVIDPKRAYYTHPIATLDFASLYPSIMMAHNLCYTTLVPGNLVKNYDKKDIEQTPNGDFFIKKHKKKGILPIILEELISARKKAKNELKNATDPFVKAVLDGRQLALKISANSVYGFTGAQVGQLPCLPISSSTTAFGRQMIELTKAKVLEKYQTKNGYEYDSDVIYGDTDSVMVKFGTTDRAEAMRLGREAAEYVSGFFESPIKLEFEKVYHPYLLMNKKRYAGMLWTNPIKYDKMDCKGIETVRRDNCGLVQDIVQGALDRLLIDFDKEKAVEFCKGKISDLLQNRIDLSLLVITKGLSKKISGDDEQFKDPQQKELAKAGTYNANLPHVKLAEKMQKRDAASAPTVGDRVAYVVVKGTKGSKTYEKSEDPIYVLENNIAIDFQYYIDNQIKLPLTRIFEPIFNDVSKAERELFSGEHTRNIYQPKIGSAGLAKFAVVKESCMGCKSVLDKNYPDVVCERCMPKKKHIYIERKIEINQAEKAYGDLWVQCQRCQLSLHQEILCTSRDCPIFYRRIKAKKNIEELNDQLLKFNEW